MNLLETWRRVAKTKTFFHGFSYNSFQNVVRVLPSFSDWLRRLNPSLYYIYFKRDFFHNMASKNSREASSISNTFSYVDIG